MKPVISPHILKMRAKKAMQGRFFKSFCIAVLPTIVVTVLAIVIMMLMPGAKETFERAVNGQFESREARMLYFDSVAEIGVQCVNLLSILFAFMTVGMQRLFLDMLRGKDVKIRNVFRYFNKWYVAMLYPLLTFGATTIIREGLDMLLEAKMDANVVTLLAWVIQIGVYFIAFKLMFVDFVLAENDCSGFLNAVKTSWRMVSGHTIVSFMMVFVSFIGWIIAVTFTAGLALVYLIPYMSITLAALYEECGVRSAECGVENE